MFARPGLSALRDQALSDIQLATGVPTLLRRSPLRALALAQAGLAHGHYGYQDWIARQSTPFTATGAYLEAWAALVGITRVPAVAATGTAIFAGTFGSTILAGSVLRRADGASYATQADVTIGGSLQGVVGITALLPGAAGTLDGGSTLTLAAPIVGVQAVAGVANGAPGADQETDAALRTRMLQRYAAPPQGGDAADYLSWALAVPGVTRAWVNPLGAGAGTVVVYTMFDRAEASHLGFPQGTSGGAAAETRIAPATGDLLTVANTIYPLRPVTALVYSVAPASYPIAFVLHPKSTVPAAVQTAVLAAIDSVFIANASPLGIEMETSLFEAAIAAVPGMPDFTMTTPGAPITPPIGYLPFRASVTYA